MKLNVLFGSESDAAFKKSYLQDKFAIPMTRKFDLEVSEMCNLSEGVERRGYKIYPVEWTAALVRQGLTSLAGGQP